MLDWRSANTGRARNSHHRNVDGRAQHLNGATPVERSAPHPDRCRDVQGSSSKWATHPHHRVAIRMVVSANAQRRSQASRDGIRRGLTCSHVVRDLQYVLNPPQRPTSHPINRQSIGLGSVSGPAVAISTPKLREEPRSRICIVGTRLFRHQLTYQFVSSRASSCQIEHRIAASPLRRAVRSGALLLFVVSRLRLLRHH